MEQRLGTQRASLEKFAKAHQLLKSTNDPNSILAHVLLPLIKVPPIYPSIAFQRGTEGYVLLEFTVDAEGRVQDPVVVEASPEGVFDKAAIKAARAFRYVPRVVDGERVPTSGVRNRITSAICY